MKLFGMTICLLIFTCGCKSSDNQSSLRLVGGELADDDHYPSTFIWTSFSESLDQSYCTGSKISDQWILTAAHCVLEQDPDENQVYIGPWKRISALSPNSNIRLSFNRVIDSNRHEDILPVLGVFLPPQIESCLSEEETNLKLCEYRTPLPDVALIRVQPGAESFYKVAPIAQIDSAKVSQGDEIVMMGYGSEEKSYEGPPRLKFSKQSVSSTPQMMEALGQTYATEDGYPDWRFFFGVASDPKSSGHANLGFGDSGGPVYRASNRKIIGVNSDGFCTNPGTRDCSSTSNSTFAKIDDAVGLWIQKTIADQ